jgi:hypothetical protein
MEQQGLWTAAAYCCPYVLLPTPSAGQAGDHQLILEFWPVADQN